MKVTFTFKNGKEKQMPERMARTLQIVGRGTYLTRDMAVSTVVEQKAPLDGLDEMNAETLHGLAKALGVKVHHNAGAEKLRAALREAAK